ncbi:peptidylprolyl isomerase [Acetivibrio mesophilus]|uniref:peptidylprolyl isomerase n=1 Tax=Acetivibrio mesophilus TaxID=2487273 RepID=A0A4Q0I766_9FIRM|nr:peptidylprolyl isomerase [Acetivibrio mesophilus]ODM25614.1 peptidylprolyl isomerase [Clostridium sp. Bc-iso-3]RXE60200.1 peptidylprolyl isomerase [Acetivibrio mesophilus]
MKKSKSIILVVSIVVLLIAGLSAATYFLLKSRFGEQGKIGGSGGSTQLTEEQANKVIAEVNGEKILYKEFYSIYSQQAAYYGITDENSQDAETKEILKTIKSDILTQLIQQKIATQKAKEAGYVVTDEKKDEAAKKFDEMIEGIAEQMKLMEGTEGGGKDYMKEAQDYINEQLEAMGLTKDEYLKEYAEYSLVTEYMEDLTKDIVVNDDDIKAYYDEQLKFQKDNPEEASYANIQLIEPSNSKVKHVLISLPEEEQQEYQKLASEGKQEEADAYLNEKLEVIKPKAEEVLNKAKSGEDFDALVKEYGEDPGMESEEYKDGYTVTKNSGFIAPFEEASLALGQGEISDLVAGPYGYHIIKVYEKNAEKAYTLEEKKSEIKEILQSEKKTTFMNEKMGEWEKASNIVRHEDLL